MKIIESPSNQIIKDLVKLKEKKNILENKLFLIEGRNIIKESIKKGIVKELFVTEENYDESLKIQQTVVTSEIIKKISSNKTNIGIIGVAFYKPIKTDISILNKIIVLENVNNPGNLGTIVRSAKAFGYECIITLGESVFSYNDKVIKSSQGTIFDIPVLNLKNIKMLSKFKPIYFELNDKANPISETEVETPFALVFGNEANGISDDLKSLWKGISSYIEIENIESLNLAVAAAIAMYKFK